MEPYVLTDIKPVQGSSFREGGSYGSVTLVTLHGGAKCIEKRLHDLLVGRGGCEIVGELQNLDVRDRFREECVLLSKLRHPNIVQFLGVRYHEDSSLSLIMEYLPMVMDKCIKHCNSVKFSIPLSFKLSILRDISYGLLYLHVGFNIIHRDLSAANVLLTSDLQAKIADLGMSRILNPDQLTRLSIAPGARYVMPPEVCQEGCQYTEKMDVFSFGILLLELMLQKFPEASNSGLTQQHVRDKEIEIGKRIGLIRKVSHAKVRSIACRCLQDLPEKRPLTSQLKEEFEQLCIENPNQQGDTIQMLRTIRKQSKS